MAQSTTLKKTQAAQQSSPPILNTEPSSWFTWCFFPGLLATLTAIFYYPSLYYAFQFDDLANIVKFYNIRHLDFSSLFFSNSRWISYWLNTLYYKIARFEPFYYRVGNVTFHVLTGLVMYYVILLALRRLKYSNFFTLHASYIAFLTAALFLLHPVETQTVSYVIQGQLEGLSGLFVLSMMLCFLLWSSARSSLAKISWSLALYMISFLVCGTKEISIVAPALLLLIDWFFVAQGNWRTLIKHWYIHLPVTIIIFGCYLYFLKPTYFMQVFGFSIETRNNVGNVLTQNFNDKITSLWYCMSQFKVIVHYITIFLWPFSISVDYDWLLVKSFFAPDCIFPLLFLITVACFITRRLKQQPIDLISFAALWFFVTILPRSSIIPSTELLVDYKTYLASLGVHFLCAAAFVWLCIYAIRRWSLDLPVLQIICFIFLLLVGFATYQRNKVWRSSTEFWENIIKNAPLKARAYNNYGVALSESGKFEQAILNFKRAISLDRVYPDPLNNIAVAYAALGDLDNAITSIKQGIILQPHYPEGYNNLASFLIQKKDYAQAELALRQAIKLRPHYGKAYFNLGRMYLENNKVKEAWEAFKNCCTIADFDNETGFIAYGMVSMTLQLYEDALTAYKKVTQLNPNSRDGWFNLGNAYFCLKDYITAEKIYRELAAERPTDARVIYNLGEVYWMKKDYQQALSFYEKAVELQTTAPGVYIRIAGCHDKLGDTPKAITLINEYLAKPNLPLDMKIAADNALRLLKSKQHTR